MCGIAAFFSYSDSSRSVDTKELLLMREKMISRGPDGYGLWVSDDRRVGLVHRRLSIIDLSEAGSQPMLSYDKKTVIIFNGEIYNYKKIRQDLENKGYSFRSTSDTEVVLQLYNDKGADLVYDLRGMYAFAIWDEVNQGLFVARDPFGIKPLYIADNGKSIRLSSQVKPLLMSKDVNSSLEPAGHVGFFLWGHVPEPYTLYKGIRAFPPGTCLWISKHNEYKRKDFFSVNKELRFANKNDGSKENARDELKRNLLDTVSHHLIADVPIGVFLSAGIDSSTIAGIARDIGSTDLLTVTLGFKEYRGTKNDEVTIAEKISKYYGARHYTRYIRRNDFVFELDRILDKMDQLTIDGINTYFISKVAHEIGLKVAMSGLGGDELFAGYSSFADIPRMVKTMGPFSRIPFLGKGFRYITSRVLRRLDSLISPKYAGIIEYGKDFSDAYLLRRGLFMPWELIQVLDADIVREGWKKLCTKNMLKRTIDGIKDNRLKISSLETEWYMRNQLLRDTDWASMAHSLEVRVPLVDIELFRNITRLIHEGYSLNKSDMATCPSKQIPSQIIHRKKTGFSVPVQEWLLKSKNMGDINKEYKGLRGWAQWLWNNKCH